MYYSIQHSMNTKVVGKFFQSENVIWNYQDNPLYLNNVYFEKIDFEPIIPTPILHKKAKVTDLISNVNAGTRFHLIMSEKLKNIILKYRTDGLQFFKTSIVKDNTEYDNYFSMNMYESNMDFIDFEKSTVYFRKYNSDKIEAPCVINIPSLYEFNKRVETRHYLDELNMHNIFIKDNITSDFFQIKHGIKDIVSEKLKREIEDAGCTGIEFMPVEMSLSEWLQGGEREKIYGKA